MTLAEYYRVLLKAQEGTATMSELRDAKERYEYYSQSPFVTRTAFDEAGYQRIIRTLENLR